MKRFPWIFSALWLVILLVMLWAGFWQLRRADEKSEIEAKLSTDQLLQPQTPTDWQNMQAFDHIEIAGGYADTHILLDNQIMDGQVGFFVFTPFQTNEGLWVLVNRGWHDNDTTDFTASNDKRSLKALVADWPRPGITLGEQQVVNQGTQHVTYLDQASTIQVLKQRHCKQNHGVGCIILPQVLKLDPLMQDGFKRDWQLPRMTVAKHQAYAAQWFTMSLVLCLVYAVFIKKHLIAKKDASEN